MSRKHVMVQAIRGFKSHRYRHENPCSGRGFLFARLVLADRWPHEFTVAVTVIQTAVIVIGTAGAGAGVAIGLVALKMAAKTAIKSAIKGVTVRTARLSSLRMGSSTIGAKDYATQSMIRFSQKHPEPGVHDVIGHGTPNSLSGQSASEVANRIGTASGGQDIRLLSCQTGCPTGSFAQDLANTLGVRVKAPTTDIGASSRGNTLTIFNGGEWRWFSPKN
jgi:hypothetical protein